MSQIKVSCLLLCAGKSTRTNPEHKLLLKIGEKSVVRKTAEEIMGAQFFEVIAVTGHAHELVQSELAALPMKIVHNKNYERGLHSSIREGLLNLDPEAQYFAVCLADQPALSSKDYNQLIESAAFFSDKALIHPAYKGQRGNPALISTEMIPEVLRHEDNDRGCFYLFERYPEKTQGIEMVDQSTLLDIDTPKLFEDVKSHLEKRGQR
jgi:molybdenum cofactor cytidylyltransferase